MNKVIPFYLFFVLLILSISYSFTFSKVFGDGLFMEQLSASFGDRKADLLIKMSPPVVTTALESQGQKPVIEFKLFDSNTNQNFKSVTYYITIEKNGKQLLSNWFFDPNGDLKIQMEPRNTSQIQVEGDLDPILNAYTSQGASDVVATGPIFSQGGLYHFIVRIVTVDYSTTILPDAQQPVFNGWLSIGAYHEKTFNIDGKTVPVKILGYYDEVGNMTYVPKSHAISFDMPFTYNMTRLNASDNNVYVHQEVDLPKPSIFTSTGSYTGLTNGQDVSKYLVVDGSNKTKDVAHFMLTKPIVLQIASKYKPTTASKTGEMSFTLMSSKNGSKSMGTAMNMTTMLMPPK